MTNQKEAHPLQWPEGWPRTRVQDRKEMKAWKKRANDAREALIDELTRMGAQTVVISTNIPLNLRGQLQTAPEPRDPSVAVYFTRRTKKQDFSWQDTLGVTDPNPTRDQVETAYKQRALVNHPDRGGDTAVFVKLADARAAALKWIESGGEEVTNHVIACDVFTTVRWNINAIRLSIAALRQIERCGATGLMDRAFKGFAELPANVPVHAAGAGQ